jgi:hypothetical protein
MLLGPNTTVGHTSVVFMIESQIQHVMSCLRLAGPGGVVEVREPALRQYNDALQRRLRGGAGPHTTFGRRLLSRP